jgi:uncharacterized protein YprB with RNaseH-like and TPR domain
MSLPDLNDAARDQKIKDLRSRLDALNRAPVKAEFAVDPMARDLRRALAARKRRALLVSREPAPLSPGYRFPPATILYKRDLPRTTPAPLPEFTLQPPATVVLEEAVQGREIVHPTKGRAFLTETLVRDLAETLGVDELFAEKLAAGDTRLLERLRRSFDTPLFAPEDFVFVDIETTGLSTSPLFLIGVMVWEAGGFTVRQFLARTYAEEAATIALFLDACNGRKLLVTFNGKSFDYPYIRNRAAASGVPFGTPLPHFDLLHESRRVWKGRLPNCKLQTLELHVCKRGRTGDIPGHLIPQAYHDYVHSGNAWQIVDVLKHNLLDLITLAELMGRWPDNQIC